MPRYYCDYCDTYLTHDSPSVRKQHNAGYKHKANIREYYQQFEAQQNQSLIDERVRDHYLKQQAGILNPMMAPRMPVPMPMPGNSQMPINPSLVPGFRPPILPRPLPPGYVPAPGAPPMAMPPGSAPYPGQFNSLPGPPQTVNGPTGMVGAPAPTMYQLPNSSAQPGGGIASLTTDSSQVREANNDR